MKLKFQYISWEKLHAICFDLLVEIEKKRLKFDRIICISRGGLVVARIFSDFLNLPISNFTIVSYVKVGKIGKPKIMEPLGVEIKGERILLIDEIVDSGVTLKKGLTYLKSLKPKNIYTLAPVIKPWAKIKPDFYSLETKKWAIFPYETQETIKDLKKIWQKEGKREKEIAEKIKILGFNTEQVRYFLKKAL